MQKKDYLNLQNAYLIVEANTIGSSLQTFGQGISNAGIGRIAVLAATGDYDESEKTLSYYIKDPIKKQKIMDWIKQNIKPIEGATTDNLQSQSNKPFMDWIHKSFVPFIKSNQA